MVVEPVSRVNVKLFSVILHGITRVLGGSFAGLHPACALSCDLAVILLDIDGRKRHDPIGCIVKIYRPRERETLHMTASHCRKLILFLRGFYTLCECIKLKPFCHRQDRIHHILLFLVPINMGHERTVDFYSLNGKLANGRDGCVASAKIVQINARAQFCEPLQICCDRAVILVGDNGF